MFNLVKLFVGSLYSEVLTFEVHCGEKTICMNLREKEMCSMKHGNILSIIKTIYMNLMEKEMCSMKPGNILSIIKEIEELL